MKSILEFIHEKVTAKGVFVRLIPFILFASLVVYSSSQTYEQQTIVPLLDLVLAKEFLKNQLMWINFTYAGSPISIETKGYTGFIEFLMRKFAHLSLFFMISLFFCSFLNYLLRHLGVAVALTYIFVVSFAVLDEFHQFITGGRTPLVEDVILDTIGGMVGIAIYIIWRLTRSEH